MKEKKKNITLTNENRERKKFRKEKNNITLTNEKTILVLKTDQDLYQKLLRK